MIEIFTEPVVKKVAALLGYKSGAPSQNTDGRPVVRYGPLSVMADRAAEILIDAKVPFYQRGNKLVRPVVVPVQSFHGQTTSTARLVAVELPYMRDKLCRNSCWMRFDARWNKWVDAHPHKEAAQVLLSRDGDWTFPVLAGIISTPTLRPDGTILTGRWLRPGDAIAADRSAHHARHSGQSEQG